MRIMRRGAGSSLHYDGGPTEGVPVGITFGGCCLHRCYSREEDSGSEHHGCSLPIPVITRCSHSAAALVCISSFAIPKLHYLLRSAPCFLSGKLAEYDSTLRAIISSVTNTPLTQMDEAWLQAMLPVKFGGLGVRSAAHVAPSAYLSSTAASADLVSALLPESNHSDLFLSSEAALARWSEGHSEAPPTGEGAKIQKNWDGIVTQNLASTLLQGASDG